MSSIRFFVAAISTSSPDVHISSFFVNIVNIRVLRSWSSTCSIFIVSRQFVFRSFVFDSAFESASLFGFSSFFAFVNGRFRTGSSFVLTFFGIVYIASGLSFAYAIVLPFGRSCVVFEKFANTISNRTPVRTSITPLDVRTFCCVCTGCFASRYTSLAAVVTTGTDIWDRGGIVTCFASRTVCGRLNGAILSR